MVSLNHNPPHFSLGILRTISRSGMACSTLPRCAFAVCRQYRLLLAIALAAIIAGGLWLWPYDSAILQTLISWSNKALRGWLQDLGSSLQWPWLAQLRRQDLKEAARAIYFWGDFLTGSVLVSVLVWLARSVAGKRLWRWAALATLLASLARGLW